MTRHIPNLLTSCNLLCGTLGIISLFQHDSFPIAWWIWIAAGFDFLDGFFARLLKVQSPIGKDLDSLADMVTFGVLPGLFMFQWTQSLSEEFWIPYIVLTIVVCSALRLAIFNNDTTQHTSFKGLPTPASALFLTSLPFTQQEWLSNPVILVIISVVISILMVSRITLFALKFNNFSWKGNEVRFTFVILSVLLVITLKFGAIPLIVLMYVITSFGMALLKGDKTD